MPNKDGTLTDEEKGRVRDHLQAQGIPLPICPFCGRRDWIVGDHLVQAVTLGQNAELKLGGIGYPQVMLISPKCGYTALMNAVIAGVLPSNIKPERT